MTPTKFQMTRVAGIIANNAESWAANQDELESLNAVAAYLKSLPPVDRVPEIVALLKKYVGNDNVSVHRHFYGEGDEHWQARGGAGWIKSSQKEIHLSADSLIPAIHAHFAPAPVTIDGMTPEQVSAVMEAPVPAPVKVAP